MKRPEIFKGPTPEEEREIAENLKKNPVTNKDVWAMFFAALVVFVPVLIIIIVIFLLVIVPIFLL